MGKFRIGLIVLPFVAALLAVGDFIVSKAITSGNTKGSDLAVPYYNRGVEYMNKGDYEHAVPDYYEAIRLERKFVRRQTQRSRP